MLENQGAIKKDDKDIMTHKMLLSEQKQNTQVPVVGSGFCNMKPTVWAGGDRQRQRGEIYHKRFLMCLLCTWMFVTDSLLSPADVFELVHNKQTPQLEGGRPSEAPGALSGGETRRCPLGSLHSSNSLRGSETPPFIHFPL